jgi:4-hydroxy-tetrahydrodipicolinate synthase
MHVEKPGLIVAPLTPFTADLDVDEGALRREIDYVVRDCRATLVVAAGVETQEYTYLSLEQRKALIRHTVACVDGRVPVMVGISHPSFRTAIELAHFAESLGAAAVQLLAPLRPFAGPPTHADLIAYFEAVARESKLPITLYLNPGPGADVSIADAIALAKLPRVELIKESSRDLARVSRLIVEIDRAGHACYFTTMQMLLATLELAAPARPCRRRRARSRGISSMPSWPRTMNAPPRCSSSSRCSRRNGCIAGSLPL